jgi:hypothetical protein
MFGVLALDVVHQLQRKRPDDAILELLLPRHCAEPLGQLLVLFCGGKRRTESDLESIQDELRLVQKEAAGEEIHGRLLRYQRRPRRQVALAPAMDTQRCKSSSEGEHGRDWKEDEGGRREELEGGQGSPHRRHGSNARRAQ